MSPKLKNSPESSNPSNPSDNPSQSPSPSATDGSSTTSAKTDPFAPFGSDAEGEAPSNNAPVELAPPPATLPAADVVATAALFTTALDTTLYGGWLARPLDADERQRLELALLPVLERRGVEIQNAPEITLGMTIIGLGLPRYRAKKEAEEAKAKASTVEVSRDLSRIREEGQRQERPLTQARVVELQKGSSSDLLA